MLLSEEYYRDLISRLGLPEMPLARVGYVSGAAGPAAEFKSDFARVARKAAQFAYYNNMRELVDAGFDHDAVMELGRGLIPENIDVYVKVPFEYGGGLELSNMFLIKKYPFKGILNSFLDAQVVRFNRGRGLYGRENGLELPPELFVPNPKGLVFLPALKGFVSPGGNSSTDRMTEIGSQMFISAQDRI